MSGSVVVVDAEEGSVVGVVAVLMRLYKDHLVSHGVDIDSFQSFEEELSQLPSKFTQAKGGGLWLATDPYSRIDGLGCVGLRSISVSVSCLSGAFSGIAVDGGSDEVGVLEVKRLFVRPEARGKGVAKALMSSVEERARKIKGKGAILVLDTLERLPEALAMYENLGWRRIGQYCENPMPDAVFLAKRLR